MQRYLYKLTFAYLVTISLACLVTPVLFGQDQVSVSSERILLHHDRSLYLTGENIWLKVSNSHAEDRSPAELSNTLYIELHDLDGYPVSQKVFRMTGGKCSGYMEIPESTVTGKYSLRVSTRWMRNLGPRTYTSDLITIVNPYQPTVFHEIPDSSAIIEVIEKVKNERNPGFNDKLQIEISGGDREYAPRSEITLEIRTTVGNDLPVPAELSISVAKRGTQSNAVWPPGSDKLNGSGYYQPETNGVSVSGQVLDSRTGKAISDCPVFIAIPGTGEVQRKMTGINGRFHFSVNGTLDRRELSVMCQGEEDYRIILDQEFDPDLIPRSKQMQQLDSSYSDLLDNMFIAMQVRKAFSNDGEVYSGSQAGIHLGPFYSESDQTVLLADFIELPNMEEVLREIVKDVLVLGTTRNRTIQVVDGITNRTLGSDPCILIDGLPVTEQEILFRLPPQEVERIEVVNSKYILGDWIMDGIIDVRTLKGSTDPGKMSKNHLLKSYAFISGNRPFNSPLYPDQDSRLSRSPDFRNTLHWEPSVQTSKSGEANIKFYCSDDTGEYIVTVVGVSDAGFMGEVQVPLLIER